MFTKNEIEKIKTSNYDMKNLAILEINIKSLENKLTNLENDTPDIINYMIKLNNNININNINQSNIQDEIIKISKEIVEKKENIETLEKEINDLQKNVTKLEKMPFYILMNKFKIKIINNTLIKKNEKYKQDKSNLLKLEEFLYHANMYIKTQSEIKYTKQEIINKKNEYQNEINYLRENILSNQ